MKKTGNLKSARKRTPEQNRIKQIKWDLSNMLLTKINHIQEILRPDHDGERVVDSVESKSPHIPLGLQRLKTVELVHKMLLLQRPEIIHAFCESQVLSNIV